MKLLKTHERQVHSTPFSVTFSLKKSSPNSLHVIFRLKTLQKCHKNDNHGFLFLWPNQALCTGENIYWIILLTLFLPGVVIYGLIPTSGVKTEMSVSFSSVSFKMCIHFQNVRMGTIFYITYLKGHNRYNIFENNFEGTPPV